MVPRANNNARPLFITFCGIYEDEYFLLRITRPQHQAQLWRARRIRYEYTNTINYFAKMKKISPEQERELKKAKNIIINSNSVTEVVLLTLLCVENELDRYLENNLYNNKKLLRGGYLSYDKKLKFALALGFIKGNDWDDFEDYFIKIGELRNKYAHKINYKLEKKYIDFLTDLNKWFPDDEPENRRLTADNEIKFVKRGMKMLIAFSAMFANGDVLLNN